MWVEEGRGQKKRGGWVWEEGRTRDLFIFCPPVLPLPWKVSLNFAVEEYLKEIPWEEEGRGGGGPETQRTSQEELKKKKNSPSLPIGTSFESPDTGFL